MHRYWHEEAGVMIHHNGDYSGDAFVVLREKPEIEEIDEPDGSKSYSITLPCAPLAQFSRWATLSEVTRVLEDMQ
jgi:hypothetical protein